MNKVFIKVSYDIFNIQGFFTAFHKFVGPFQIEQSIQESLDKCFRIWFHTDVVEIKEGELRQVDIVATQTAFGGIEFKIQKL